MTDQTFISDDGSIGSQPVTWDGEPLYSPASVKEGLFDADAFEQIPGQLPIEPERSTWDDPDGSYSYAEARYKLKCDDCGGPDAWNTLNSLELQLCDRCYYCRLGRP